MSLESFRNFRPAGPVASAFMADRVHKVRALLGPVGGGKTVSCIFDTLANTSEMPVCIDGVIRYRIGVIGKTYGQIERNLLPSWHAWLPADGGDWTEAEFKGGGGRFATHRIGFDAQRGGGRVEVQFEAIFAAIGEHDIEQFMRGFECTAFWLYEMDLLPEDVLKHALFRVGRWPRVNDEQTGLRRGTNFRRYVIGDLNAPDTDSWFYRRFEEECPPDHKLYKQPSGRSPRAENKDNLPPGYYEEQIRSFGNGSDAKRLVRRMVDAQYAPSVHGEPVFPEWEDEVHFASDVLAPVPGVGLLIGFDQGVRNPAATIGQRVGGQLRVLAELLPGRMGPKGFARELKFLLADRFPRFEIAGMWADPAGSSGSDLENDLLSWTETLQLELGLPIQPAPSNALDLRLEAVRDELTYLIDGRTPSILVSRACPKLRKGFASDYLYVKRPGTNTVPADAVPDKKNPLGNLQDALQYQLLGEKGRYGVIANSPQGRAARRERGARDAAGGAGGTYTMAGPPSLF